MEQTIHIEEGKYNSEELKQIKDDLEVKATMYKAEESAEIARHYATVDRNRKIFEELDNNEERSDAAQTLLKHFGDLWYNYHDALYFLLRKDTSLISLDQECQKFLHIKLVR